MVSVSKFKVFIITYDGGDREQVLKVSHQRYNNNPVFQRHIKHTKCLDCNVEFNFDEEQS